MSSSALSIPIPKIVYTYPEEQQQQVFQYLSELSDQDKQAYSIAYEHLGSSFNIIRSNGFVHWLEKKRETNALS